MTTDEALPERAGDSGAVRNSPPGQRNSRRSGSGAVAPRVAAGPAAAQADAEPAAQADADGSTPRAHAASPAGAATKPSTQQADAAPPAGGATAQPSPPGHTQSPAKAPAEPAAPQADVSAPAGSAAEPAAPRVHAQTPAEAAAKPAAQPADVAPPAGADAAATAPRARTAAPAVPPADPGPAVSPAVPPLAAAGPAVQLAHQQLSRLLDQRVWMPGSQLPGERALAKRVGVSRSSLRLALAILETEGRVHASAQRGWFVRAGMVSEPPSVLKSFSEVARERGLTATARVLSRELRSASYEEARRLRTAPAVPVLEIVRVRSLDDVPVCLDTTVLARAQEAVESVDLTDKSLFSLLEGSGVRVMRSAYTAHAEAADHRISELLGIPAGSPVLVCDEVTHDQTDTPVMLGRAVYRGDAYRFEATLLRGT